MEEDFDIARLECYALDSRVSIISREFHLQWCRSRCLLAGDHANARLIGQLLSELHARERLT